MWITKTESPFWLEEAYSSPITDQDLGLLSRNIHYSGFLERFLLKNYNYHEAFLDYAGGYGMLVRLMRDKGFDFYRYDKYCQNLFSSSFDLNDAGTSTFELITAFEFFEHLEDPFNELNNILEMSDSLLFSTLLIPQEKIKSVKEWWYFAPETGQHITFYTLHSLQCLAEQYSAKLYSNGRDLHLITRVNFRKDPFKDVEFYFFKYLQRKIDYVYRKWNRIDLCSKLKEDVDRIKKKNLK